MQILKKQVKKEKRRYFTLESVGKVDQGLEMGSAILST